MIAREAGHEDSMLDLERASEPIVSVVVPTYNSERTIADCLRSVMDQDTAEPIETIVVDSESKDSTVKIAESCGARVITTSQKLLGARITGLHESKGKFALLLDSDQLLDKTAISRACKLGQRNDMVILEEFSTDPGNLLQRLISRDRRLSRSTLSRHLQPETGILLPRFFRRGFLEEVISHIPESLSDFVVAYDHAIIYYESVKLSSRIGIIPRAIYHEEPSSLLELWRKNYRYGLSAGLLARSGHYSHFLRYKEKVRMMGEKGSFADWVASTFFLSIKAVPYELGYEIGARSSPNLG
jgi:glycosyltransferase involved in cell wall biosynthesis